MAAHGDERVERGHAIEVEVRRAYREQEHPGKDRAEPDDAVPHYRGAPGGVVEDLGPEKTEKKTVRSTRARVGRGASFALEVEFIEMGPHREFLSDSVDTCTGGRYKYAIPI